MFIALVTSTVAGDWEVLGMAEHELRDKLNAIQRDVGAIRSDVREVRDRVIRAEGRMDSTDTEMRQVRSRLHDVEAAIVWIREHIRNFAQKFDEMLSIKAERQPDSGEIKVITVSLAKIIIAAVLMSFGAFWSLMELMGKL